MKITLVTSSIALMGQVALAQPAAPPLTNMSASAKTAASDLVTSQHLMALRGRSLAYEASAGTLSVTLSNGARAGMFYVAYTSNRKSSAPRPVMFLFNGGPGSASLWLHLGSFGPRRLETNSPAPTPAAGFRIVDNQQTLLDATDLVFIDAVGTGYSRASDESDTKAFYGVDGDLDAFAGFISGYLTRYNRWSSPKFVLGESYGATRTAALANVLQRRGVNPTGVVLLSSILNFSSYHPGIDRGFINMLPSMAATAWYHHRAGQNAASLPSFVEQARRFAAGDYADALQLGDQLPAEQEARVRSELARFTGLAPADIQRTGLRVDTGQFAKLLLGGGQAVGIYDSRASAEDTDAAAQTPSFDPADTVVAGVFPAANADYLVRELGYRSGETYRTMVPGLDHRWDWSHEAPGSGERLTSPAMALDLSAAMHRDPTLRVLSLNGYYDLGTPFFGTEYDLAHMQLSPAIKRNLAVHFYPAGHMIYLDAQSRAAVAEDIRSWVRGSSGGKQ